MTCPRTGPDKDDYICLIDIPSSHARECILQHKHKSPTKLFKCLCVDTGGISAPTAILIRPCSIFHTLT